MTKTVDAVVLATVDILLSVGGGLLYAWWLFGIVGNQEWFIPETIRIFVSLVMVPVSYVYLRIVHAAYRLHVDLMAKWRAAVD